MGRCQKFEMYSSLSKKLATPGEMQLANGLLHSRSQTSLQQSMMGNATGVISGETPKGGGSGSSSSEGVNIITPTEGQVNRAQASVRRKHNAACSLKSPHLMRGQGGAGSSRSGSKSKSTKKKPSSKSSKGRAKKKGGGQKSGSKKKKSGGVKKKPSKKSSKGKKKTSGKSRKK